MSSEINNIAMRASVAAVNKGSSLRVYETDVFGGIREVMYEGKWTGGGRHNVIATGKIGSPVAATSLGLDYIRVYYVGADDKAREICYDKDGKHWYNGGFSDKFTVAPYSGMAAIFLEAPEGQRILRVYGQLPNNTIQEWCYNGGSEGWTAGTNLGDAIPGSSIAATTWGKSTHHIRVYMQDPKLNIIEKAYDGTHWQTGGLHVKDATPRAAVGVTSWMESNVAIRLYYGSPGDVVKEKAWDHDKGWYDGGFSEASVPASHIAAIPKPVLRVYIQNGTMYTAVTEFAWEGRWVVGEKALPPA